MNENKNIELTQEDIEMGNYIYTILLSQPTILMSWGVESPVVVKLGLQFKVNGFKHKGLVRILYNEGADLFDIELFDSDMNVIESLDGIYFDQLVDTIDEHVERVKNYNERVDQEYNFETYEEEII